MSQQVKAKADETASGMRVWPPGIGLQGLIQNHLVLLRSKDLVASDGETADWIRQVCDETVSASEPLMTRRYSFQTLPKREVVQISWISVDRACLWTTRQPAYRRHELIAGPDAERENLPSNALDELFRGAVTMRVNTDVCVRIGATRSSDDASVMDSELGVASSR